MRLTKKAASEPPANHIVNNPTVAISVKIKMTRRISQTIDGDKSNMSIPPFPRFSPIYYILSCFTIIIRKFPLRYESASFALPQSFLDKVKKRTAIRLPAIQSTYLLSKKSGFRSQVRIRLFRHENILLRQYYPHLQVLLLLPDNNWKKSYHYLIPVQVFRFLPE